MYSNNPLLFGRIINCDESFYRHQTKYHGTSFVPVCGFMILVKNRSIKHYYILFKSLSKYKFKLVNQIANHSLRFCNPKSGVHNQNKSIARKK